MARLYSNENFPLQVVVELRAMGHDVLTIQEQGKANEATPDPVVLQFAVTEGRAILTLNRKDFIRLHYVEPAHSGIIVCTVDPDYAGQARRIHEAINNLSDLQARLIRVNRPNTGK